MMMLKMEARAMAMVVAVWAWGDGNCCIAVVNSGLCIFTSPWQEANLSCDPCSKGTKNCRKKCGSVMGIKESCSPQFLCFQSFRILFCCGSSGKRGREGSYLKAQ